MERSILGKTDALTLSGLQENDQLHEIWQQGKFNFLNLNLQ